MNNNPFNRFNQYGNPNEINYSVITGQNGFDQTTKITQPNQKAFAVSNILVVDSRQRDCNAYPSPSNYSVRLGDVFNNVTSIELKGAAIPRSCYNINNGNNSIDFSVGTSITSINIISTGQYYNTVPTVTISSPNGPGPHVQATATANINSSTGQVVSITITNPGSGYIASAPPTVYITPPVGNYNREYIATARAVVGNHYQTKLRIGQYSIGGNPSSSGGNPTGLINEIQNAMNYAVNGVYSSTSTSPFEVRLVSQYPELNATGPEAFDTNATQFNRIQITNVNSDYWSLLWCSGPNHKTSAGTILGFVNEDMYDVTATPNIPAISPIYSAGLTLRASYDYDLLDDPKFIILSFKQGADSMERTHSQEGSLNGKFAVVMFDSNSTDTVKDTTGTNILFDGSNYLQGPITKGPFWSQGGVLKALKGTDLDQKKLIFNPPITLTSLDILITSYGQSNGHEILYDFQGRNHTLIFEIVADDQLTGRRA